MAHMHDFKAVCLGSIEKAMLVGHELEDILTKFRGRVPYVRKGVEAIATRLELLYMLGRFERVVPGDPFPDVGQLGLGSISENDHML